MVACSKCGTERKVGEKCRPCRKAYREANREQSLESQRRWREENKGYTKAQDKEYRRGARKRGTGIAGKRRVEWALVVLSEIETEHFTVEDYRKIRRDAGNGGGVSTATAELEVRAAESEGLIEHVGDGVWREARTTAG